MEVKDTDVKVGGTYVSRYVTTGRKVARREVIVVKVLTELMRPEVISGFMVVPVTAPDMRPFRVFPTTLEVAEA